MSEQTIPAAFNDFDVLEGFEPTDKAELVGVPFGITAVRYRTNESHVQFVDVEIVNADGEEKTFSDSSSGVRDQLTQYLHGKGLQTGGTIDWQEIKLFVPNGLRCSNYEVKVEGQTKAAKTYYLTLKGRKRA